MVENIEIDNDRLQQTNNGFTLQNSIFFFFSLNYNITKHYSEIKQITVSINIEWSGNAITTESLSIPNFCLEKGITVGK